MCGITGFYSNKYNESDLIKMTQTLLHRGPDANKVYFDEINNIGLGHTRLSILDLSDNANQPMVSHNGRYVMVYNGEVYNYRDIAAELKQIHQIDFKTSSDSEVILEALQANNYKPSDIDMLIPHQANLRIIQFIQHSLKLADDKVYNNIQYYGNTTAASVPIALCEAWENGKIKQGDLVCLAAFGSGFTWASALIKW